MRKGISPFIASIVLIALAVTVAGVFSTWLTSFTKETAEEVGKHSEKRITCSYGGIALEDLKYNKTAGNFSGKVENIDIIPLGNIDLEIFYGDDTRGKIELNMALEPGEKNVFNIAIPKMNSTTYNKIRVITNCSNVYDEVSSIDISEVY